MAINRFRPDPIFDRLLYAAALPRTTEIKYIWTTDLRHRYFWCWQLWILFRECRTNLKVWWWKESTVLINLPYREEERGKGEKLRSTEHSSYGLLVQFSLTYQYGALVLVELSLWLPVSQSINGNQGIFHWHQFPDRDLWYYDKLCFGGEPDMLPLPANRRQLGVSISEVS